MTKDKKEEESTLKKKLTAAAVIVAALALILAVSMFGCSKDTTAAEDKTEKTVSTGEVETVQDTETQEDKVETPTVEQPSAKAEAEDTSSEEEPKEAAEDTESDTTETEQASQPVELFSAVNETVYATTTVNIRDTYSVNGNQLGSLSTAQSATRTGIGTGEADGWSRIEFNGQAAYVSSDYLSTVKIETSTPTSKPSTPSQPSGGGSSTPTSKPSTPTSNPSSGGSSTTQTTPPPSTSTSSGVTDDNILGNADDRFNAWANSLESDEWGSYENAQNSYVPTISQP